jgi:hypothetical protein
MEEERNEGRRRGRSGAWRRGARGGEGIGARVFTLLVLVLDHA